MINTFQEIKLTVLTQWHFVRWIRLAAGVFFAVQGVLMQDAMAGFVSMLFLFQAFTNTGCCGASGCSVPAGSKKVNPTQDVEYEEIKSKN